MISNPIDEQALISKIVNQLSPDLQKALLDIAGVEQALSGVKNDVAGVKSDVGTTAQALTTETNQIDNKLETLTATNGAIDNTATAINQHTTGELDALELALINAVNAARDNGKAHTTSINDALEAALINAVNGAKSHTTSQHTSTKSALTTSVNSARDNTKSHVTTEKTAVVSAVNVARDDIKAHVTAMGGVIKSITRGMTTIGGSRTEVTIPLPNIDPTKTHVTMSSHDAWIKSVTSTALVLGTVSSSTGASYEVVEFK